MDKKDWEKRVEWIDDYVRRIKPYVRVREKDSLLIKIPNQAWKLNPGGVKLLAFLLGGGTVMQVLEKYEDKESISLDVYAFFRDLGALLKGCYDERAPRRAVEKTPFALPFNQLPVLSEIALTYRCNLACRFCYASCGCRKDLSSRSGDDSAKELGTARVKEMIDIIAGEAQIPSLSFTGGEPLLRRDIAELVAHAKKRGLWVNLITNGTLADAGTVAGLKAAGLDSAQVSIEAGEAALHDRIAAVPGAFARTLAGVKNFMAAGVRVHTNTTVSALNKDAVEQIAGLVKELGLKKFSMNMLMPVGTAGVNLEETFISYTEIGPVVERARARAAALGLEFMWYSPTPVCIYNPIARGLGNKGCSACDGLLSVAPNGDILPCSSYPKPMGNLLEHRGGFAGLWSSAPFKYFQEKRFAHALCKACDALAHCNGACPLYWERAGYKELEAARAAVPTP
ncbi:MAG TPA: radical SAM protein [Elusimicrobiales bacterium]|nr:radical SAM protein [Elusimicrobiales bacterium]